MERVIYRKNLDVYKNGVQFVLQGFETADNLSRIIEISLMSGGDSIDFPEGITAMMYTKSPSLLEPSIDECSIVGNKVVYEIPQIPTEGITTMQLKLVESTTNGATSVLASPKFAIEIVKSNTDDSSIMQKNTFTAFENAVAKAKTVYDKRFLEMSIDEDCIFKAFYADGTIYETDILKRLFHVGSPVLAESYAKGGTGVRSGEDTDNAKYYSNIAKSEALTAQETMKISEAMLNESKKHGVYTAFSVRFDTGELEYISPAYDFSIQEDGQLKVSGKAYSFEDAIYTLIDEWLETNGVNLKNLESIAEEHATQITSLLNRATKHEDDITTLTLATQNVPKLEEDMYNCKQDIETLQEESWTTIHAEKFESETLQGESHNIKISLGVTPEQLQEFNEFRVIMKKGSMCLLSGGGDAYKSLFTLRVYFDTLKAILDYHSKDMGFGEKTVGFYETEQDIVLSHLKKETARYNASDGTWSYIFQGETAGFPDMTIIGYIYYTHNNSQKVSSTLKYTMDIEVQGRR